VKDGHQKLFTTRVFGYSAVLMLLVSAVVFMLATRTDIEATILKVPGQLYQEQPNNRISNIYNIQFINKTTKPVSLELKVKDIESATIRRVGDELLNIGASERVDAVFFIEVPRESIKAMKTELEVLLISDGEVMDEISTNFIGPAGPAKR
jgi:polyferredoxin